MMTKSLPFFQSTPYWESIINTNNTPINNSNYNNTQAHPWTEAVAVVTRPKHPARPIPCALRTLLSRVGLRRGRRWREDPPPAAERPAKTTEALRAAEVCKVFVAAVRSGGYKKMSSILADQKSPRI